MNDGNTWLDANERPQIRSTDSSVWERLKPIPFEFPIRPEEIDKGLPHRLRNEAPGILVWMVQGCLLWCSEGLGEILDVAEARKAWREECDPLQDFITDECELRPQDPDAFSYTSDLRSRYDKWCEANAEKALSRKAFAERLKALGCREGKRYEGSGSQRRTWERIRLARHKT